jgi:tetratricopeptide (TPR) repeat protein
MNMELNQQKPVATMDCQRVAKEEIIERYLAGKLPEAEAEAFEQHYLGCQSCFEELQLRHATAMELKRLPVVSSRPVAVPWSTRWTWILATAAVLFLTLVSVTTFYRRPSPQVIQKPPAHGGAGEEILARLARVETAPPYVPLTIRGGKTGAAAERFQEGMRSYMQQKYAGAIGPLQEAVRLDPSLQPALFYLGISHLMLDQPDEAVARLSRLTRLEASPYTEESHWYLAKAFLKKRDWVSAQRELEAVVALNGPHLPEARQALELIRNTVKGSQKGISAY